MKMKKTAKTLAMVLLTSTTAKAFEKPVLVSAMDLKNYEQKNNLIGLTTKLFELGLITKTSKSEIFIFNDVALSKIDDEQILSTISNLIDWLTDGEISVERKNWKDMTPSTQDYKM